MQVIHYQRRPRPAGNYSLEAIFEDLRKRLPQIESRQVIAPFFSNGLLPRLAIAVHAWYSQKGITHITGDITFAALLLRRKTTVLTILDCIGADRPGLKGWLYRKIWFEWPVRRSAIVSTISEASKKDIILYSRCSPNKVIVTGVAISPLFKKSEKNFNKAKPRILQVGTAPNKNIERLAIALKDIKCELRVIGKLNESQLQALSDNAIVFSQAAGLSEEQLVNEYRMSDIIAFASTLEGFGMPILEGNAVGRVVVTSNCKSMPEVAGKAACLVDPFSTVSIREGFLKVIGDDDFRATLIENGFRNLERFSPQIIADRYYRIYLSLNKT
jgi:glycosyltransferase involved in cell wall biosynthesis